ncbi:MULTISPECIES: hypothetical protein [Nostocales]|uniref:Uncharacterized protein n=3 Tax=Nostocales TaxID=1161 RepID=A0ABW8WVV9_9CYAN
MRLKLLVKKLWYLYILFLSPVETVEDVWTQYDKNIITLTEGKKEHIIQTRDNSSKTLIRIFLVTLVSFTLAQVLGRKLPYLKEESVKAYLKLASVFIFGFATLNRLTEIKYFDGTGWLDKTNTSFFKLLYFTGFGLGIFALSLDNSIQNSISAICHNLCTLWNSIPCNEFTVRCDR